MLLKSIFFFCDSNLEIINQGHINKFLNLFFKEYQPRIHCFEEILISCLTITNMLIYRQNKVGPPLDSFRLSFGISSKDLPGFGQILHKMEISAGLFDRFEGLDLSERKFMFMTLKELERFLIINGEDYDPHNAFLNLLLFNKEVLQWCTTRKELWDNLVINLLNARTHVFIREISSHASHSVFDVIEKGFNLF